MDTFFKDETRVDQYVKQNKREAAVKLLFDLISKYAKKKDFEKAEALREKLFEVDAMALTEIIKSAEIIEEEKEESVDHDHLTIWSDMYDSLTTEEAHTLYLAMEHQTHDTDTSIFRQSELNAKLCFINHGTLKIFYSQGNKEILLRTLSPGDIAGEDTFFSITVCTTSLVTLSRTELSFLDKDIFAKWQNDFPSLSSKLSDYCQNLAKPYDLLREKGIDRRAHKRIRLSGKVMFQVLNASGSPIGSAYKGMISDVSPGGLSFDVKISKKNALLLLARKLNVKFLLPRGRSQFKVRQSGIITGVTNTHSGKYAIHLKFDRMLNSNAQFSSES